MKPITKGEMAQGIFWVLFFLGGALFFPVVSGFAISTLIGAAIGAILGTWLMIWFLRLPRALLSEAQIEASKQSALQSRLLVWGPVLGISLTGLIRLIWGEPGLFFGVTLLGVVGTAFCSALLLAMVRHNRRLARQQDERWRPRRESSERWRS